MDGVPLFQLNTTTSSLCMLEGSSAFMRILLWKGEVFAHVGLNQNLKDLSGVQPPAVKIG